MQKTIELKILDERLIDWGLPSYAKPGDAGMDLRACIDEPLFLEPGETRLVPTGISVYLNDENLVGYLVPRSGLATKYGLNLANCIGTIDSSYTGQIYAAMSRAVRGTKKDPHWIAPGDRICQLIIAPIVRVEWDVVPRFSTASARGDGGFGSSGHG